MDIFDIFSLISSGIMFLGVIFGIYFFFRKPQDSMETRQSLDALATEKDKLIAEKDLGTKATILAQKELETKALVLAENVKNKDIENERRFTEMGVRLDASFTLAQNHIHTVDTKVDNLINMVNQMNLGITRELAELSTTIKVCFKDKNI